MNNEFASIIAELEKRNEKSGVPVHDAILVNTIKALRQTDAMYERYEKEISSNAHKVPFELRELVALKRAEIKALLKATYATITVDASPTVETVNLTQSFSHATGFADKSSALKSIKLDIARSYPFVMHYTCKYEMLTYFATLLMNYSNHDKRDVEITLKEIEHGKIHWQLTADHEILDAGNYIIDKDVPF